MNEIVHDQSKEKLKQACNCTERPDVWRGVLAFTRQANVKLDKLFLVEYTLYDVL